MEDSLAWSSRNMLETDNNKNKRAGALNNSAKCKQIGMRLMRKIIQLSAQFDVCEFYTCCGQIRHTILFFGIDLWFIDASPESCVCVFPFVFTWHHTVFSAHQNINEFMHSTRISNCDSQWQQCVFRWFFFFLLFSILLVTAWNVNVFSEHHERAQ